MSVLSPPAASAPVSLTQRWFFLRARRRQMPVLDDLGLLGEEHVAGVTPLVDRIVQPVEVRPPERLVLAPVISAGGREHRDGRLLGCAGIDAVAGERHQGVCQFVGVLDRYAGSAPAAGRVAARWIRCAISISQSRSRCVDRQS